MPQLNLDAQARVALRRLKEPTLDELITEVAAVRNKARALQKEADELKVEQKELEKNIISKMEAQGLEKMGNSAANVAVTSMIQPSIDDWETVVDYIVQNKAFYLLYKQIGATAYRELLESGETVPGLTPYEQKKLSIRKAT